MTAPNWQVKKETNPKNPKQEWKVVPQALPSWENNDTRNFFYDQQAAQKEADDRNHQFDMISVPTEYQN